MSRYTGPIRYRGPSLARAQEGAGRALLGDLVARTPPAGVNQARKVLADGTVAIAHIAGDQRTLTLQPPAAPAPAAAPRGEEMIRVYIGSSGGLRIVDLGTKELLATITGLEAFEVDGVDRTGRVVLMSTSQYQLAARVDLATMEAFGAQFAAPTDDEPTAVALQLRGYPSPDGTRVLYAFEASGVDAGGGAYGIVEGLGGHVLADAESLAALRPAIRMTGYLALRAACWAPDSQRFFLSATRTDDAAYDGAVLSEPFTSYLATFDRDGVLQGTLALGTVDLPSNESTFRVGLWQLVAHPDGTRLYAVVENISLAGVDLVFEFFLVAIDITEALPVEVARVPLPEGTHPEEIAVLPGGQKLAARWGDTVRTFDLVDDALASLASVTEARLGTTAERPFESEVAFQRGPLSRLGRPPDPRAFFLSKTGAGHALLAYRGGFDEPVYTLPLDALNVFERYRLISAGPRVLP